MQELNSDIRATAWADVLPQDIVLLANQLAEKSYASTKRVFPPREKVFAALSETPPEKVRCVIVGQDPYHEQGQANGLAFSVAPGIKIPPSLRNIHKELVADIGGEMPEHGDLTAWAKQGVLLLNTRLTVAEGEPNTPEFADWEIVTRAILERIWELPQPITFLLWGKNAVSLLDGFDRSNETKAVFCSTHPSPLAAGRASKDFPAFLGSRPFSRVNVFLKEHGVGEIDWKIPEI